MASRQAPFFLPLRFWHTIFFLDVFFKPRWHGTLHIWPWLHPTWLHLLNTHRAWTTGLPNHHPKESSDPWIRQALRRTSTPVGDVLEPFHTLSPHCKPHSSMSSGPWYSETVPHKPNISCGSQVCSLVSGDTERVTKHVLAASATSWRWPCIPWAC